MDSLFIFATHFRVTTVYVMPTAAPLRNDAMLLFASFIFKALFLGYASHFCKMRFALRVIYLVNIVIRVLLRQIPFDGWHLDLNGQSWSVEHFFTSHFPPWQSSEGLRWRERSDSGQQQNFKHISKYLLHWESLLHNFPWSSHLPDRQTYPEKAEF